MALYVGLGGTAQSFHPLAGLIWTELFVFLLPPALVAAGSNLRPGPFLLLSRRPTPGRCSSARPTGWRSSSPPAALMSLTTLLVAAKLGGCLRRHPALRGIAAPHAGHGARGLGARAVRRGGRLPRLRALGAADPPAARRGHRRVVGALRRACTSIRSASPPCSSWGSSSGGWPGGPGRFWPAVAAHAVNNGARLAGGRARPRRPGAAGRGGGEPGPARDRDRGALAARARLDARHPDAARRRRRTSSAPIPATRRSGFRPGSCRRASARWPAWGSCSTGRSARSGRCGEASAPDIQATASRAARESPSWNEGSDASGRITSVFSAAGRERHRPAPPAPRAEARPGAPPRSRSRTPRATRPRRGGARTSPGGGRARESASSTARAGSRAPCEAPRPRCWNRSDACPSPGGRPGDLGEQRGVHPLGVERRAEQDRRRSVAPVEEPLERDAARVDEGGTLQVLSGLDHAAGR